MALDSSQIKINRILVLFILLLDLIGFSLIFPLVPDLLEYYLKGAQNHALDGWLPGVAASITNFLPDARRDPVHVIILMGGIMAAIYSILQFLTAPSWGRLSDRIGRRWVLILTSSGLALAYLIWFFSSSFTMFLISRVVAGIMAGNLSVASAAMADMSAPEERTKQMGMVGAAFGVGFVIGPAMGGLAATWNLQEYFATEHLNPFAFCALVSFALSAGGAILNFLKLKETLPEGGRSHEWIRNPFTAFKEELNTASFNYVLLLNFIFVFIFSGFEFTVTFFYKLDFGLSPMQIGFVFFYLGLLIAIGQGGIVRRLTPKMGEKAIVIIGFGLIPLPLFLLSQTAPSVALSLLCLLPIAIGSSLAMPGMAGLASLTVSDEKQGFSMGVFRSSGSLARAVGPIAGSYLYWFSGVQMTYLLLAIGLAASLSLAFALKDRRTIKNEVTS